MGPDSSSDDQEIKPEEVKPVTEEPVADSKPVQSEAVQASHDKKTFKPTTSPKSNKSKIWLLFAVVIIIVLAVGYWFLIHNKKSKSASSNTTSQSQTVQTANSFTPNTVAYAFKSKDTDPLIMYNRPAAGGDRTTAKSLANSEAITDSDVSGSNVVVASANALYASTDSGKTYTSILNLTGNAQLTSLKFSSDGQHIVFGYLPGTGGKNTVKITDLKGQNSKDLFTSTVNGVFIIAYNATKQQIIYQEGCFNCDGGPGLPVLRDLKTTKASDLISGLKADELASVAVSSDFSTLVYAKASENSTAPQKALGVFTGAPYTINSLNITNNKLIQIASFGVKGEKNTNGTLKSRQVQVGFVAGTNTPYYSNDTQLDTVKSGSPSLVYETTQPILIVQFVNEKQILAGYGTDTSDYTFVNYAIQSKKATTILQGDNNTIIFGVTTQ